MVRLPVSGFILRQSLVVTTPMEQYTEHNFFNKFAVVVLCI